MTTTKRAYQTTYQLQYRKCGKRPCTTCRIGKGHGPYFYAYFREGGKLRSRYIGKASQQYIARLQREQVGRSAA